MNIILTGSKRSGKSTAAEKILKKLSLPVSGFRTVFENRWDGDKQTLFVVSLDGSKRQRAATWRDGRRDTFMQAFDEFAPDLISQDSELVFIDELGFLEKDSESLQKAVTAAFDGPQDVLAVIRLDAKGWMQELKERNDVIIFTVTEDNRAALSDKVLELFKK